MLTPCYWPESYLLALVTDILKQPFSRNCISKPLGGHFVVLLFLEFVNQASHLNFIKDARIHQSQTFRSLSLCFEVALWQAGKG